jgi:hypothetical protein
LALLGFQHGSARAVYVEKTGSLPLKYLEPLLASRFTKVTWPDPGQAKSFTGFEEDAVRAICQSSALCFFPSTRKELPHWLNPNAIGERGDAAPRLEEFSRVNNRLEKPFFIERCGEDNKRWILDVLFDSRTEIVVEGNNVKTAPYDNLQNRLLLTTAKTNIDRIIQAVLGDADVRIHANYRSSGPRLAVAKREAILLPSLDNLSLGQSLLFNLFCTIARYADRYDLRKGHQLDQIGGIVIIDEVDSHLHTDLQFSALPKLIRLFPKVQFVVTTHAPMFLLGMEREFGPGGVVIHEMPSGEPISTERFSEFQASLDHYRQTKAFEAAVQASVLSSTKPTVILEGDTDRDYLLAYLDLLGRNDLLSAVTVDLAGRNVNGSAHGGGKDALDIIARTFKAKLGLLTTKLLLVHDCDSGKKDETLAGKLYVRTIPHSAANGKFTRGIENLLPETLARPEFYDARVEQKYSGVVQTLNKLKLCDWVIAQRDINLFQGFAPLLAFIEEFVKA